MTEQRLTPEREAEIDRIVESRKRGAADYACRIIEAAVAQGAFAHDVARDAIDASLKIMSSIYGVGWDQVEGGDER